MDKKIEWREHLAGEAEAISRTAAELGMHPLAVEDCLRRNQRAKFDDYETHQLLVWFVCLPSQVVELEFVVFPGTLVLVASAPAPRGGSWREFLGISGEAPDVHHLLYQALDFALDMTEARAKSLFSDITKFEDALFKDKAEPLRLIGLKRALAGMGFATASLGSVVSQWQRFLNPKDDLRWRMRDLFDHCERIQQALVFHQTQVAATMDMYWGLTSKRTNDQIKKLTMVASVSVPLTVWASFWGMNFQSIPFDKTWLLFAALALMALSVAAVAWYLKARGYLDE